MLDRLFESKAMRSRSPVGTMSSVVTHFAVIALAVHATAQTRSRPRDVSRVVIVPFVPQRPAPAPAPMEPTRATEAPAPRPILPRPLFAISIDPNLPPITLSVPSPTQPTDFPSGASLTTATAGSNEPSTDAGAAFRSDQVERQVSVIPGAPVPRYPEALRSAGVEGQVIAEFVVNELGRAEVDSVRFVRSDNVLFEESVRNVLNRMRFTPAQIGGRNVRQLVRMPFVFTLGGR